MLNGKLTITRSVSFVGSVTVIVSRTTGTVTVDSFRHGKTTQRFRLSQDERRNLITQIESLADIIFVRREPSVSDGEMLSFEARDGDLKLKGSIDVGYDDYRVVMNQVASALGRFGTPLLTLE